MIVSRPDVSYTELTDYGKQSFLKLDINKYMGLLGQEPIPPQIALVNAVNNPAYRFIVAMLSRRTGKTYISNIIGQLVVLVPSCQILIISPNYSLSNISWDLQKQLINTFDIETTKSNAKDKVIELANASVIRIGSVSQVDSVVGRSYDLIIFDEAALNNDGESAFNIQLRPTLDKIGSKCIFISTPRRENWFYQFYLRGFSNEPAFKNWVSIFSTWEDNPRADKEDILAAKATLSKAEFAQEYECSIEALQGRCWEVSSSDIVDLSEVDFSGMEVFAGVDLGFRDPTAMVVCATSGDKIYIVDEYLLGGVTTAEHAAAIRLLMDKWNIDFIYVDSANQQMRYDFALTHDIPTVNATKSVNDGIGFVSSLFEKRKILISSSCVEVLAAVSNYRWDDREGLINEKPLHDKYSHMADAIRYALYTHSLNYDFIFEEEFSTL